MRSRIRDLPSESEDKVAKLPYFSQHKILPMLDSGIHRFSSIAGIELLGPKNPGPRQIASLGEPSAGRWVIFGRRGAFTYRTMRNERD